MYTAHGALELAPKTGGAIYRNCNDLFRFERHNLHTHLFVTSSQAAGRLLGVSGGIADKLQTRSAVRSVRGAIMHGADNDHHHRAQHVYQAGRIPQPPALAGVVNKGCPIYTQSVVACARCVPPMMFVCYSKIWLAAAASCGGLLLVLRAACANCAL